MKRILLLGVALVCAAAFPGCVVHRNDRPPRAYRTTDVRVSVPADRAWYYRSGHRHGPGCGHVHVGGRWCHH